VVRLEVFDRADSDIICLLVVAQSIALLQMLFKVLKQIARLEVFSAEPVPPSA